VHRPDTVDDEVVPVAVCQDITVELDASGNAVIEPEDIDDGSDDACGIANLFLDETDFDCTMVGPNEVTLSVSDVNGNFSTCTAIVTVVEATDPQALCQDITVELDEFGAASITPEDINNGSSDACGIATLEAEPTEFDCSNVGPNVVVLTVTDNNGNESTCEAIVTIVDLINPEALCQNITVELGANGLVSITLEQIDNGSSDACGIASITLDIDQFDCEDIGGNLVVLTVTDNNNNVTPAKLL
jgi:hypothetical protein